MPYYDLPPVPTPPIHNTIVRYYSFDVDKVVECVVSGHLTPGQAWAVARHHNTYNILASYSHVTTTREIVVDEKF